MGFASDNVVNLICDRSCTRFEFRFELLYRIMFYNVHVKEVLYFVGIIGIGKY